MDLLIHRPIILQTNIRMVSVRFSFSGSGLSYLYLRSSDASTAVPEAHRYWCAARRRPSDSNNSEIAGFTWRTFKLWPSDDTLLVFGKFTRKSPWFFFVRLVNWTFINPSSCPAFLPVTLPYPYLLQNLRRGVSIFMGMLEPAKLCLWICFTRPCPHLLNANDGSISTPLWSTSISAFMRLRSLWGSKVVTQSYQSHGIWPEVHMSCASTNSRWPILLMRWSCADY